MDKKVTQKMTPFDMAVTDEHLQTLKLLLPYMPPEFQSFLGIYVKFIEFQNTVTYFHSFKGRCVQQSGRRNHSFEELIEELKNYYPEKNFEMMETMMQTMNMMKVMQDLDTEDLFNNMNMNDVFQMFQQERTEQNGRMDESSCDEKFGSNKTGTDSNSSETDGRKIR